VDIYGVAEVAEVVEVAGVGLCLLNLEDFKL